MSIKGEFVRHEACPLCGSADNVGVYKQPDGTLQKYCFSCEKFITSTSPPSSPSFQLDLEYVDLKSRGITRETCEYFGYGVTKYQGTWYQAAPYFDKTKLIGYKLRDLEKNFKWLGDGGSTELFGMQLCSKGGKRVYVTEGEIDALSVAQALGVGQWAVVSVPSGALGSMKAITKHIDFLEAFEEIVLLFDNDEVGMRGLEKAAGVLSPQKLYVVNLGKFKDANELLCSKGAKALRDALLMTRTPYRPMDILSGANVDINALKERKKYKVYTVPSFQTLQGYLGGGIPSAEIIMLYADTGVGKTTLLHQLTWELLTSNPELKIGYLGLEEPTTKTLNAIVAMDNGVSLSDVWRDPGILSDAQYARTLPLLSRLELYNHFGSISDPGVLEAKVRYMAAQGCHIVVLDHVSMVVSGMETDNERRAIDKLMTDLRVLVEQTGVGIITASHIKNTTDKSSGDVVVNVSSGRGSGALKQLSDIIIGMEKRKEGRVLKLLKNRDSGDGVDMVVEELVYDRYTGRYIDACIETLPDEGDE